MIALLTDFGLSDHYVAAMKGVMLGIAPDAAFLDITHDIPPQDILGGALELEAVAPYLPDGAVVLAVVDPGVGTMRRGVAIETGRLTLVGPDNGLFSALLHTPGGQTAVALANGRYHRPVMSRTFEGRDRFAPVAAHLATGTPLGLLGPEVGDLVRLDIPPCVATAAGIDGVVLRTDRFGNLITNIRAADLERIGTVDAVLVAGQTVAVTSTYGEAPRGSLVALVGSTGRLELAVSGGSAALHLGLGRGAVVSVRRR